MKPISVVIPLGTGSTWDNNELRYMLRSLDCHLQFDYEPILFCSEKIPWLNCKQIVVKRYYPKKALEFYGGHHHYENYYDVINKIRTSISNDNVSDEFLYAYDDILLLYDLYKADIRRIYAGGHYDDNPKMYENKTAEKWMATISNAMTICKDNSYAMYNYETHLPRYFKKELLQKMFNKHNPETDFIPYAISTVYYNMNYEKPDFNYHKENKVKAGFYGGVYGFDGFSSQTEQEIKDAIKDKVWINYNNKGLTIALMEFIQKQFPNKSRWEE